MYQPKQAQAPLTQSYTPPIETLAKYARILVDFALGAGKGIKEGDVVYLQVDLDALPLAQEVFRHIVKRGGQPMVKLVDQTFSQILIGEGTEKQLTFFPEAHMRTLVDTIDHRIYLMAPRDPFYLKDADPRKVMLAGQSLGKLKKWLFDKEDQGGLTWTLCLYGTDGLAREAGLTLEDFWGQISLACFLHDADPVATWQRVNGEVEAMRDRLSALPIDTLHVVSKDTDLIVKIGADRKWLAGSGHNIPSFEIFTSPDWRGTEGHIYFDYPLYHRGNVIKDIRLTFKNGEIIEAKAGQNEALLKQLIAQKNANKIGEYSLTDIDFSKINRFMANTLYDENFGGEWGNTHLAVGSSYHEAYTGDRTSVSDEKWAELGFNESPEHTDIMATNDRIVEATLLDGTKKVIYAKGHFVF